MVTVDFFWKAALRELVVPFTGMSRTRRPLRSCNGLRKRECRSCLLRTMLCALLFQMSLVCCVRLICLRNFTLFCRSSLRFDVVGFSSVGFSTVLSFRYFPVRRFFFGYRRFLF